MRKLGSIGSLSVFARADGAVMLVSGSNAPEMSFVQAVTLKAVLAEILPHKLEEVAALLQTEGFCFMYSEWEPEKKVIVV